MYERLRAHKREGESFSDVIERLTEREGDVWAGYGNVRESDGHLWALIPTISASSHG